MNELKIQIATLGKTLEALEERIERTWGKIWQLILN
jgi:tetrahydromethanopterin S-methyltransferase subunit G